MLKSDRGGAHMLTDMVRCSPADSCRSRPVTYSVRVSRTAPACKMIPDPSADTVILGWRAVFAWKVPSAGDGQDLDKPYSPSSKGLFI